MKADAPNRIFFIPKHRVCAPDAGNSLLLNSNIAPTADSRSFSSFRMFPFEPIAVLISFVSLFR